MIWLRDSQVDVFPAYRRVLAGFIGQIQPNEAKLSHAPAKRVPQRLENVQVIDWSICRRHEGAEYGLAACFFIGPAAARPDLERVAASAEAQIDFGGSVGGRHEFFTKPAVPADTKNSCKLATRPLRKTGRANARYLDEPVIGGTQARDRQDFIEQGQLGVGTHPAHHGLEGLAR
jgi:hypothetical protein